MPHWREEYAAALAARDRREKANSALYDAYTKLADRTSALAAPPRGTGPSSPATHKPSSDAQRSISSPITTKKQLSAEPGTPLADLLNATRTDLSEAQRSRSELQDRLNRITTEAEKLRKKSSQDSRRISALESERVHLQLRLKDRDEELRGKAKLLEDFQDEMATLNLQLNMAEERSTRFQHENQELVDRWMARMGQEAEAMNDASKFS
ncbi:hypothetical protein N7510_004608 [Penicillium lagena]|uniref:uncharacterized protein n=1 Tax=Penicillium lagena TaxID=94218 RepID=UPI0025418EB0|nr:uncharacterized protein N7510_004608 [Penicillium lagena]KAJ5620624.1 hypothetical protein N7510_004608 [Penicillium lagena]